MRRAGGSQRRGVAGLALAAAALVGAAVVAALIWSGSPRNVHTVDIGGVTYTTNAELREEGGGIYLYLPVNTDIDDVVLELDDPDDTLVVRELLRGLDTFLPGEHTLELPGATIQVIIDGIDD